MIWNYQDQRSQSHKEAKKKEPQIIHESFGKFEKKIVKFVNYSQIIPSKFGQSNNLVFRLPS